MFIAYLLTEYMRYIHLLNVNSAPLLSTKPNETGQCGCAYRRRLNRARCLFKQNNLIKNILRAYTESVFYTRTHEKLV